MGTSGYEKVMKAFLRKEKKRLKNDRSDGQHLYYHGNCIAEWRGEELWWTLAGWNSSTTRLRVSQLPGVRVWSGKSVAMAWDGLSIRSSEWLPADRSAAFTAAQEPDGLSKEEARRCRSLASRFAGKSSWRYRCVTDSGHNIELVRRGYYSGNRLEFGDWGGEILAPKKSREALDILLERAKIVDGNGDRLEPGMSPRSGVEYKLAQKERWERPEYKKEVEEMIGAVEEAKK